MANDATGISRKRDVFQLDDNGAPDADTSDAVGWSRDDGLGYRMLSAKHGDIVYAERSIESSVKYDYSSPVRHMNKRPGFGDISVAIHDANEVATSIKLPTK